MTPVSPPSSLRQPQQVGLNAKEGAVTIAAENAILLEDKSPGSSAQVSVTNPDMLPFNYEAFLRRMRHPSCRPLLTRVKQLINKFRNHATSASLTALIHVYRTALDELMIELRENPVWRLVGEANPQEYELAREGLEYLVMNQIHPHTFATLQEDRDKDEQMYRKMLLHQDWLTPAHLDIGAGKIDQVILGEAIGEFRRVNEFLTPRDKLICLLNGCKILQGTIFLYPKVTSLTHPSFSYLESIGGEASADEMMPILIYAMIKAQVPQLNSNLQYINRYRDQRALASDRAYHFTSLLAVATFIERLDQSALVISVDEYERLMETAVMHLNEKAILVQEDEAVATQMAHDEQLAQRLEGSPQSPERRSHIASPPSSPRLEADQFKAEATRLFLDVKEKIRLGASKSIEYLGDLMDKAEAKIRGNSNSNLSSPPPPTAADLSEEQRAAALAEEDEFQLQLAMALSLSEQDHHQATETKGKEPAEPSVSSNFKLVDVSDEVALPTAETSLSLTKASPKLP